MTSQNVMDCTPGSMDHRFPTDLRILWSAGLGPRPEDHRILRSVGNLWSIDPGVQTIDIDDLLSFYGPQAWALAEGPGLRAK